LKIHPATRYHKVTNGEVLLKILSLLRCFILCWMLLASGISVAEPLRMGIITDMARGQYALLDAWRIYLQDKLGSPVEFVFRDNYQESADLIKLKQLDFAWLPAPAYLGLKKQVNLLATPLYQGRPFDRAYLIVPATDQNTASLAELKDKIFVYTDSVSNTGYLTPRHQLRLTGHDPEHFFAKTFFTHDHQKVVAAVAIGLADGGSLSGFVWETLALTRPDISSQTRVVAKSAEYGFPPIVAQRSVSAKDFANMQKALLGMSEDAEGIKLLKQLNLDGFALADEKNYRGVSLMLRRAGEL